MLLSIVDEVLDCCSYLRITQVGVLLFAAACHCTSEVDLIE